MPTPSAPVAAHDDLQRRGTPPERLVCQPPDHRVARRSLATATTAPLVRFDDPAGQHRPTRFEPLPGGFEAELVKSAERGQVRAGEGSIAHVEVFRMGSVRTSILGDLDAYPGTDAPPLATPSSGKSPFTGRDELGLLNARQPRDQAPIDPVLPAPAVDRLVTDLQIARHLGHAAPRLQQIQDLPPELRRIPTSSMPPLLKGSCDTRIH